MIQEILKRIRLARLKGAIKRVERSGLSVVQVKIGKGCVYLIGSKGTYVRFDKAKQ